MNNFSIIGRLTKNPELRYTINNKAVTTINVAVNNNKNDTTFLPIMIFNKLGESINKYCEKGDMLGITGIIKNNNWEDKNGNKHYDYNFIAQNITFVSKKDNSIKKDKKPENELKNELKDDLSDEVFAQFGESIEISDDDIAF
jgi:single-strand DNA-binding protein